MEKFTNGQQERKARVAFATGLAALDGAKPTAFTRNLLNKYIQGSITSTELKNAILDKYSKSE